LTKIVGILRGLFRAKLGSILVALKNLGFIKKLWGELKGDILRLMPDFHHNGKLTKSLNSAFIALIPKVDNPQRLNDFRPMLLVGSLYKILAKVLANK
jgi:hypothetical protein